MKRQFINNQLIVSLVISSAFVAFTTTFGTLYFRRETFIHANNLKRIEAQCAELESENLILSARIAQLQAPCYLKEKAFALALGVHQEQVLRVRGWNDYKELFLTRSTLAMNTPSIPGAN
ncbi:MAG: hypothetical protein LBJ13_03230 [Puniceicoccales bacterium]|jgi:hypothetical protein|nr:hypothetical protein [Puniceicoccales bacterium]